MRLNPYKFIQQLLAIKLQKKKRRENQRKKSRATKMKQKRQDV